MKSLKQTLNKFYSDFDFAGHVRKDPIEFPHRYKNHEDIEVSGFIASCFAYGRVDLFKPVIDRILSIMGSSPYSFLRDFDIKKQGGNFSLKYRFNETKDILCLLFVIHKLLAKYSSIGNAFNRHYSLDDPDTGNGISGLVREIMSVDTSRVYGKNVHPRGLLQFFPSPGKGSACKRMNLFLRWMVRDRDIDFGIWRGTPKNKLVIPLDTHIARVSRCLGFTQRASSDWKTASEITSALKKFDPEDPLRYDFALCHRGISGLCKAGDNAACRECAFR
ncbi:MAG TPA: TIGR02757 family protein [Thermodesulfovibrionales bacterium]|nr:TIGR02757 family protein [Thermodesulfovibrionales bacterium]